MFHGFKNKISEQAASLLPLKIRQHGCLAPNYNTGGGLSGGGFMKRVYFLLLIFVFLSACTPKVYKNLFNTDSGPNVKTFNAPVDTCYLAAKRAVLSQNLGIEKEDLQAKSFTAARYFEDGKDSIVLSINANVIATGNDNATIYISAVQYVEKVRVKTDRLGLSLGLIPVGSEATKVKQEERTVEDVEFYKKFFEAVEREIKIISDVKVK